MLPDVLDSIGVPSGESLDEVLVCPFDGLGVTFQSAFTPAHKPVLGFHSHEEPPRWHPEVLENYGQYSLDMYAVDIAIRTSIFVMVLADAILLCGQRDGGSSLKGCCYL